MMGIRFEAMKECCDEEMGQLIWTHTTLVEETISVLCTPVNLLTMSCNSTSIGSEIHFENLQAPTHTCIYLNMCASAHIHTKAYKDIHTQ